MQGSIASLETLSGVDGPGIRTVVFLNGCYKRCLYCHNPEMFKIGKPNIKSRDLANKLIRYKNYYQRGGGVTFSGGEPLLQTNFLIEVIKTLKKENIHIAIDTAGDYLGDIKTLLKYVDLVILDIKDVRSKEYEEITGCKLETFEKFISILNQSQVKVSLRHVIVPKFHDNLEYLNLLKEYTKKINHQDMTFIPYHTIGIEKYQGLNIDYPLKNIEAMDEKECEKLQEIYLNL